MTASRSRKSAVQADNTVATDTPVTPPKKRGRKPKAQPVVVPPSDETAVVIPPPWNDDDKAEPNVPESWRGYRGSEPQPSEEMLKDIQAYIASMTQSSKDDDDSTPPAAPAAQPELPLMPAPSSPAGATDTTQATDTAEATRADESRRILVRGFGRLNREMVMYVQKIVLRAKDTGDVLVIEDEITGVGAAATYYAKQYGVPTVVIGKGKEPVNPTVKKGGADYMRYIQYAMKEAEQRAHIAMLLVNAGNNPRGAQVSAQSIKAAGGQPYVYAFA